MLNQVFQIPFYIYIIVDHVREDYTGIRKLKAWMKQLSAMRVLLGTQAVFFCFVFNVLNLIAALSKVFLRAMV